MGRPDSDGLWCVTFELGEAPPLEVLTALEELGSSASIFELESEGLNTTRWQVELLLERKPDLADLRQSLQHLLAPHGIEPGEPRSSRLEHEDWLAKAAMPREPLEVGRFLVHGKDHAHLVGDRQTGLEIEAGLAFGSGDHGSTMGCLLAIERVASRRRPKRALDMGCGSAILAIAMAKAFGARVVAVDNDPIATRVAAENARRNGVGHRVETYCADGYRHRMVAARAPFDLITANILAEPLCNMAGDLRRHLAPGGWAVLSGLLDRQAELVIGAHRHHGLRLRHRLDLDPWTTLVLRLPA